MMETVKLAQVPVDTKQAAAPHHPAVVINNNSQVRVAKRNPFSPTIPL